jgi:hypothetical protein
MRRLRKDDVLKWRDAMKTAEITLYRVGMQVTWIDEIPKEEGLVLLDESWAVETTLDKKTELSMAASRIYSGSVRMLEKLKRSYGPGPFTVTCASSEFANRDTSHPQHIQINAAPGKSFSGYWFKLVE